MWPTWCNPHQEMICLALTLHLWSFKYKRRSYASKHGKWHIGKFSCPIFSLFCEAYIEGKPYWVAFPNKVGQQATKPLKIMYSDVCDLMRITSIGNARYFVTFIDKCFEEYLVVCCEVQMRVF